MTPSWSGSPKVAKELVKDLGVHNNEGRLNYVLVEDLKKSLQYGVI